MLVGALDGQRVDEEITRSEAIAHIVLRVGALDDIRARGRRKLVLTDHQMVDVVLHEERIVQAAGKQRLVVGQAGDVFGQDVVGRDEIGIPVVRLAVAGPVEHIVQGQLVAFGQPVRQVGTHHGQRPAVMPQRLPATADLAVGAVDVGAVPIIAAVGGVDGLRMVHRMGGRDLELHAVGQEIHLLVAGRDVERLRVALRHTDHAVLRGAGLDVLVDLRHGGGYEEGVRPTAVGHADLHLTEQ